MYVLKTYVLLKCRHGETSSEKSADVTTLRLLHLSAVQSWVHRSIVTTLRLLHMSAVQTWVHNTVQSFSVLLI